MRPGGFNQWQVSFAGLRFWLTLLFLVWLVSSVGLWWIVKSIFVVLALIFLLPLLAIIGLQLWLKQSLVNGACPVCGQALVAIQGQQLRCNNCGEPLSVINNTFKRVTPPGTVDVAVVDVSATEED